MKALVYDGPEVISYRDVPDPVPDLNEHLIQVQSVGICGSDMHAYLGHDNRRPAPLILGHEAAGVVIGGTRDGERVTINPLVACGKCAACKSRRENLCAYRQIISMPPREGAFAQYVSMPGENLITIPDGVPMDQAALAEPLAVSWHAARLGLAVLHPSDERRALILGGGAIGLAAALALRAMGCEDVTVVEPNASRRAYLNEYCGVTALDKYNEEVSLVVDAVGFAATRAAASQQVKPGGVIVHIGLGGDTGGLDVRRITLQEITFIGTYTYTVQDFHDTAQAIFDGRLGDLNWVEKRPLSEGREVFQAIRSGQIAAPKTILHPNS